MKKIHYCIATALLAALVTLVACHENVIDETRHNTSNKGTLSVTMNVDDPELFRIETEGKDTIFFYGDKQSNGMAETLDIIEVRQTNNKQTTFHMDKKGRPTSIRCSNNVQIDFEWIDESKTVIKARDFNSNTYLTTMWDIHASQPVLAQAKSKASPFTGFTRRSGRIKADFSPFPQEPEPSEAITKSLDNTIQTCLLTITQCDEPVNRSAWIDVYDTDDKYLTRLHNHDVVSTGNYLYVIPSSTYPTVSNAELCERLDLLISLGVVGTEWLVAGGLETALILASTGIGAVPAEITLACTAIAGATYLILSTIDTSGGVSNIMKSFNPQWYYKPFHTEDMVLFPTVDALPNYIYGLPHKVSPEDRNIYLSVEIKGVPTISSFELDPSYPNEGQDYAAVAKYFCIPYGSSIQVSIVGTDGYTDSISEQIPSSSGEITLYVPGAETGVCDVCEVVITLPSGEKISMQASLVFGL